MIKGLLILPKKSPKEIEIENSLESLQKEVEGYIELVRVSNHPGIAIIVNEEGRIKKMAYNRYVQGILLVGPILVFGEEDGELISLTDKQISEFKKLYGSKSFI